MLVNVCVDEIMSIAVTNWLSVQKIQMSKVEKRRLVNELLNESNLVVDDDCLCISSARSGKGAGIGGLWVDVEQDYLTFELSIDYRAKTRTWLLETHKTLTEVETALFNHNLWIDYCPRSTYKIAIVYGMLQTYEESYDSKFGSLGNRGVVWHNINPYILKFTLGDTGGYIEHRYRSKVELAEGILKLSVDFPDATIIDVFNVYDCVTYSYYIMGCKAEHFVGAKPLLYMKDDHLIWVDTSTKF